MIIKNQLFGNNELEEKKSGYTTKVTVPHYEPSVEKPALNSLLNTKKYDELISDINASGITEEEKEFLRLAATRHIVFNYSKIADYYANSDAVVQNLMEKSALVIIDLNDAIANGFVKFDNRIKKYAKEAYKKVYGDVDD